jgi:hypothetical protein
MDVPVKLFQKRQLQESLDCARDGGQALWHVGSIHRLFDDDTARLALTAKSLGVRPVIISLAGKKGQSIELRGKPLVKALALCATPEMVLK